MAVYCMHNECIFSETLGGFLSGVYPAAIFTPKKYLFSYAFYIQFDYTVYTG